MRRTIALDDAFARGRAAGRLETMPFRGVQTVVAFPATQPMHAAVMAYERDLLDALPAAYGAVHDAKRQLARSDAANDELAATRPPERNGSLRARERRRGGRRERQRQLWVEEGRQLAIRRLDAAEIALVALFSEIERVRVWLDAFVATAEEYAAVRPELRTAITPPEMPATARRFDSIEAFVADDSARALPDWPTRKDAQGADFGHRWSWQDPRTPWIVRHWRVSYIEESGELYAYELPIDRRRAYVPFGAVADQRRCVWLLASNFRVEGERVMPFTSPTWQYLTELERRLMHQRNSLVLIAESLPERSTSEGR